MIGNVHPPRRVFSLPHRVGPPIANLPPAGVLIPEGSNNVLPFPFPNGIPAELGAPVGGTPINGIPEINLPT